MIRHIVLFKIKDEYKDEIPQLVKNFYGMKGRIEGMVDLEAGADLLHSDRSYDIALTTVFDSREALEAAYAKQHGALNAAQAGVVDDVIEPKETRKYIIAALEVLANKHDVNLPKKHGNLPL